MLRPLTIAAALMFATPVAADPSQAATSVGTPLALARHGDRLRVNRYLRTVGDADEGPCFPKSRSRTGPLQIWSWPDWTVEHYDRLEGASRVESRWFAADGHRLGSATYRAEHPQTVSWGNHSADVSSWVASELKGALFWHPPDTDPSAGIPLGGGTLTVRTGPKEAVFSRAFRTAVAQQLGAVPLDQDMRWIQGEPTVRYRFDLPHPTESQRLWLWATTVGETSYLFAYTAPADTEPAAAEATVALVEWR